jgi:hypothetical protein
MTETSPLGQFMLRQAVALPPKDYFPAGQSVQPQSREVAPVFDAIWPAGQVCAVQAVTEPQFD